MEHIRQYDWCASVPEVSFLKEDDIDNSVIEKIIHNRFRDPLISSDSETETPKPAIDWNEVFKRKNTEPNSNRVFVAGMRSVPHYTKLSALKKQEHFQCLKVLCANNPNVLSLLYMPRPTKVDFKTFEEVKEKYLEEQKEYIEWAKTLWTNTHCSRALRPKPTVESVYEAEYKMKAHELQSFPKHYYLAAQIALEGKSEICEMVHKEDLITVKHADLPKVQYPDPIDKRFSVLKQNPVPEPCNKHPCWFVLPNEKSMSVLPLTEVHRELAQFAVDNGSQIITSEGALKALLEVDQDWCLPVSVHQVVNVDGDKKNVLVLGSEFTTHKKFAMARTHKAYRHLVEFSLIPAAEKAKKLINQDIEEEDFEDNTMEYLSNNMDDMDVSSDDDEGHLLIDEDAEFEINSPERSKSKDDDDDEEEDPEPTEPKKNKQKENEKPRGDCDNVSDKNKDSNKENEKGKKKDEFYSCNCKDSLFVNPPPRSYTRWQLRNSINKANVDLIVHCSHKTRNDSSEVVIEPIVEYQLDLGGSRQSEQKLKSLALSLFLRKNASLLNVRLDSTTGEVVTIDNISQIEFKKQNGDLIPDVSKILYEMFMLLQGLLPGHYILQHEISHGPNALLFSPRVQGSEKNLVLDFNFSVTAEADEAKSVKVPQVLAPVLLPVHKFRKMLPCAFPPFADMLGREPKKPVTRQKTPPQAIRWPKKKNKKRPGGFYVY